MYCVKCGTPNDESAKFCIKCSTGLIASPPTPPVDCPPSPMQSKPGWGVRWKTIFLAIVAVIVLAAFVLAGRALQQRLKSSTGQNSEDAEPGITVPEFRFMSDPEMVRQSNPWGIAVEVRWYGEIAYDETRQGSVEKHEDVLNPYLWNSWGFSGNAGDVISIEVRGSAQLHPLIELFDSSDTEEGLLLKTGGEHSRILIDSFALPYSGTYYIVVGGVRDLYGDGEAGEYEITLQREGQ